MHWSQQTHDNGAILDLLPNHKGRIGFSQKIGHKTHDDVEGDIRHTEALNQRLLRRIKDSLPEIKGHKSPHDIANPIENKVDSVSNQLLNPCIDKGFITSPQFDHPRAPFGRSDG